MEMTLFYLFLNSDWKGPKKEAGWIRTVGNQSRAEVQSPQWATNGSVTHHFSILAALKLFSCHLFGGALLSSGVIGKATRSSVASAISEPPSPLKKKKDPL